MQTQIPNENHIYSWKIRRSGASMSIEHSCGKLTQISEVTTRDGEVIATAKDGREFVLRVVTPI